MTFGEKVLTLAKSRGSYVRGYGTYYLRQYFCTKAAVYTAERFVLQETFLSLKIRGLLLRAVSNQEWVIMARIQ